MTIRLQFTAEICETNKLLQEGIPNARIVDRNGDGRGHVGGRRSNKHQTSSQLSHWPTDVAPCRGADLSPRHVTDDAAMGGHNLSVYAFKNESLDACTLKGYPVFELLNKSARLLPKGRAINSRKLMGDEAESDPQLVTIEPGKEAIFRVYSNNGGAGYMGKPCPVSRFVSLTAPGTTRAFVLKSEIRSCQAVKVSAVRPGSPE